LLRAASGSPIKIGDRLDEQGGVIIEPPDAGITVAAKKTPDGAALVAVIDREPPLPRRRAANRTDAALGYEHVLVSGDADLELCAQDRPGSGCRIPTLQREALANVHQGKGRSDEIAPGRYEYLLAVP
jgi:hypothetical protein